MFRKVLIANRGEIAIRIMRTCRSLGIATVAVYSDADRTALHVRMADESYPIGPAPARDSYLSIPNIMAAARESGADAVHPGYGFLSENPAFAAACHSAGLTFIGPTAEAMEALGNKAAARALAVRAGVPVVPGYHEADQRDDRLLAEADIIGYPVLIKAAAGGGGRGQRVVETADAFPDALASARREALAAFGSAAALLERYVPAPRHIEVQVFGDHHGTVIHLGERECSVQRRHQKVIEEAPSPAVSAALRAELGAAAVRLAQAAGYTNAGTCEFLLDPEGNWYFLEMNTRLQVEHPVTEEVTGLNLVELQLRIAAGEPLSERISARPAAGHAIEARLYAEDPADGYLPSTGTLTRFRAPQGAGIRNEIGVTEGDQVGAYYDAMLAKLIVTGSDRAEAVRRLRAALDDYEVAGVTTNLDQLRAVAADPAFLAADFDTHYLERLALPLTPVLDVALAAAAWELCERGLTAAGSPRQAGGPWYAGPWRSGRWAMPFSYAIDGRLVQVTVSRDVAGGTWALRAVGGEDVREIAAAELQRTGDGGALLRLGPRLVTVPGERTAAGVSVTWEGRRYQVAYGRAAGDRRAGPRAGATPAGMVTAPMPGRVVAVNVREGDTVAAYQVLVVLEAMKMEHPITAPFPGVVRRLPVREGEQVAKGAVVVEVEAAG